MFVGNKLDNYAIVSLCPELMLNEDTKDVI